MQLQLYLAFSWFGTRKSAKIVDCRIISNLYGRMWSKFRLWKSFQALHAIFWRNAPWPALCFRKACSALCFKGIHWAIGQRTEPSAKKWNDMLRLTLTLRLKGSAKGWVSPWTSQSCLITFSRSSALWALSSVRRRVCCYSEMLGPCTLKVASSGYGSALRKQSCIVGCGLDSAWIFTRCETLKRCMEMKSCNSDETETETGCFRLWSTSGNKISDLNHSVINVPQLILALCELNVIWKWDKERRMAETKVFRTSQNDREPTMTSESGHPYIAHEYLALPFQKPV